MIGGWLRKAVREPLLHFAVAGASLFLFSGYYGDVDPSERQITLDEAQVARLAERWQQTWRRPPSAQELDGMIRDHIKEEVYFREAMRLGLDAEDPIIRRRLRSKMEFLATAQVENAAPSEAELERFFAANKARYTADPAYSFDQRYYGEDEVAARATIAALNAGGSPPVLLIPLPSAMERADTSEIAREFGGDFAESLRSLTTAKWSGPIRSGYGWHAVRIRSTIAAATPLLEDIRQRVTNDWRADTRARREAAAFQTLLDGYDIRIAKP